MADLETLYGEDRKSKSSRSYRAADAELKRHQKAREKRQVLDVVDRSLMDLMSVYRDVLVLQTRAGSPLVNEEQRVALAELARTGTAEETLRRIDAIARGARADAGVQRAAAAGPRVAHGRAEDRVTGPRRRGRAALLLAARRRSSRPLLVGVLGRPEAPARRRAARPGPGRRSTTTLPSTASTTRTSAGASAGSSLQCATVEVPLDYDDPDGRTHQALADPRPVAATPTSASARCWSTRAARGCPASTTPPGPTERVGSELTAAFDLVGFDPRGVGESTPLECADDDQRDRLLASDPDPDTPAEVRDGAPAHAASSAEAACATTPHLTRHVSTEEAARDMDIIRAAALGQDRLVYYGASYGTYLGARYAELFPDRVGRMVLDGAVDPELGVVGTGARPGARLRGCAAVVRLRLRRRGRLLPRWHRRRRDASGCVVSSSRWTRRRCRWAPAS